jgi:hypothetical protein
MSSARQYPPNSIGSLIAGESGPTDPAAREAEARRRFGDALEVMERKFDVANQKAKAEALAEPAEAVRAAEQQVRLAEQALARSHQAIRGTVAELNDALVARDQMHDRIAVGLEVIGLIATFTPAGPALWIGLAVTVGSQVNSQMRMGEQEVDKVGLGNDLSGNASDILEYRKKGAGFGDGFGVAGGLFGLGLAIQEAGATTAQQVDGSWQAANTREMNDLAATATDMAGEGGDIGKAGSELQDRVNAARADQMKLDRATEAYLAALKAYHNARITWVDPNPFWTAERSDEISAVMAQIDAISP